MRIFIECGLAVIIGIIIAVRIVAGRILVLIATCQILLVVGCRNIALLVVVIGYISVEC